MKPTLKNTLFVLVLLVLTCTAITISKKVIENYNHCASILASNIARRS